MQSYIYQSGTWQTDCIQGGEVEVISNSLVVDGRIEVLSTFFSTTDLYLGLWTGNTLPIYTDTLSSFIVPHEFSAADYGRLLLPKEDWIIDETNIWVLPHESIVFKPYMSNSWNNISGFFISSTKDNTGFLLSVTTFKQKINLPKNNNLVITPKLVII